MQRPERARAGALGDDEQPSSQELSLPDYDGANIANLLPALVGRDGATPAWLPEPVRGADQVVLLVLDGLGARQLDSHGEHAPALSSMSGGAITSVAPTTTATALSSIVTGTRPCVHGIVGYRIAVAGTVLNVLRWTASGRDAREAIAPSGFSVVEPFLGTRPPVVTRNEFKGGGFSAAHLGGSELTGWSLASSIRVEVGRHLRAGAPFIYAYYDGIDRVAHATGLGEHYDAELSMADRIVSDLLSDLPEGACLVVTADHGHVEVTTESITLSEEVMTDVEVVSGEGRFRWLHVRPGSIDRVVERLVERYGDVALVRTRDELVEDGLFGGPLPDAFLHRLGDVALLAHAPVAFSDPSDTAELALVGRHGSLTRDELEVPLVAWAP